MITLMSKAGKSSKKVDTSKVDLPLLFTTADALSQGIPSSTFHRLARRGDFQLVARGLYTLKKKNNFDLDLAETVLKAPSATICLTSALVENELSDEIPRNLHIAIPRGSWAPKTTAAIKWHRFDPKTFEVGRTERPIWGTDLSIGIYSPERTLADLARHPKSDQGELVDGIRRWLRISGNNPAKLLKVAQKIPGASHRIRSILEILS